MAFFLPPGGLAGFRQMTPASRMALTRKAGLGGVRKRRKSRSVKRTRSSTRTTRRKGKRKGPKFGTPAFNKLHRVGQFRKKRK